MEPDRLHRRIGSYGKRAEMWVMTAAPAVGNSPWHWMQGPTGSSRGLARSPSTHFGCRYRQTGARPGNGSTVQRPD